MRRPLLLVALVALLLTSAAAQQTAWQWVNPLPQGNILNGVWSVNQDTVFSVGDYGTVVSTTNGGTTWNVLPTAGGMLEPLFATHFISGSRGWAAGASGQVIRTTDAGSRWSFHQVPTISDLFAVYFASSTTGWVAGAKGVIYGTTDAGLTWSAETTGTIANLYGLQFIDASNGWAVGATGKILRTTNGGATWTPQTSGTTQPLYAVSFINATTGFATGAFGTLLKTVNGGSTWTPQVSGTSYGLYALQFTSALNGWGAGAYGTIVKTTNGGISWFEQSSSSYNDFYGARFVSSTLGWAVGDFGTIVKTTDGGATWVPQSSGTKNTLNAVSFPSASAGFAVGEEGTIIRSTDGGLSWAQVPSGVFQSLYGCSFINATTGFAVGDSAVILKSTNGGLTWSNQNSRSEETLYSIHFINATNGFAVGDFGTILATTNGGTTWLPRTTNTFTTFLRVKFATASIGWAVGYGGSIYKSTDGGVTWEQQVSGTTQTLYSLETIDANTVYVVGDFGTILKTTDGGADWNPQTTGLDASFYGVTFYSATTGWAVGDDGTIIGTTNGGTTWKTQNSGTLQTLWEVQLVRGTQGGVLFAAGYGGTLIASGVSPLPVKTWTGAFDSAWTNAGNWSPIGVPEKLDSVIIPLTAVKPSLRVTLQQVNIAALRVAVGQKLTVGPGVAEFAVKRSINIDGALEVEPQATTHFVVGESFVVANGATFSPGASTVIFTNPGSIRGSFNTVVMAESAHVRTLGNVSIANYLLILSDLTIRSADTLTILNRSPYALQGNGTTGAGTIRRAIEPTAIEPYRFESPATSIRFLPGGTPPDTVTMTTFPKTLPPGQPDSVFVKRYYSISAKGGSNYLSTLSLRFDTSETAHTLDELALFRDSSDVIWNMGQSDFLDSDYVAIIVDSVRRFSNWYIGQIDYVPTHRFAFLDSLILRDNGGAVDTLIFGAVPLATDGLDAALGETVLSPKPAVGNFDVRWQIPSTQGTRRDIRDVVTNAHLLNTYTASLQAGPGGFPFTLDWNPALLPPGTFLLRDAATHGGLFSVNMRSQSSYVISNPSVTTIEITHNGPIYYSFNAGWNIVSLPLTPTIDGKKTRVFPTATSSAFLFSDGYLAKDTLANGIGYWLKFPTATSVGIDGFARTRDTIEISPGWNMIGTLTDPLHPASVIQSPPGNVTSSYFQFATGYVVADSLRPAKGYWVKANAPGTLILATGPSAPGKGVPLADDAALLAALNSLEVSDADGNAQALYFSDAAVPGLEVSRYELPPAPPAGSFGARFATGTMVAERGSQPALPPVEIRASAYPVTVRWNLRESGARALIVRDAATGAVLPSIGLAGCEGSVRIGSAAIRAVTLSFEGSADVPKEYALLQNYPNPFNPTTTIAFELPENAQVSLSVFNVLGQEVARLADQEAFTAGRHALSFDASSYGSGIYFTQFVARGASRDVRQVRKMAFIK